MHSFLLIGQSNMAGRGFIKDAHDIDTSMLYTLRMGIWYPLFRPINPDKQFAGVSLGESFAESYVKKYNVNVGVCCASGGTKLEQWEPGKPLFDNAVYQAKLAMRSSEIKGILWHQGESDCSEERYPTYGERLKVMIDAFRKELDLYETPFILGGLGDFLMEHNLPNYVHVNEALKNVAQSNEHTGFVSAEGLTSNSDYLHFNSDSLYEFGIRYFNEFERLNDIYNYSTEVTVPEDVERSKMEML